MTRIQPVTIIGGGWAGLAAALELSRHRIPVTLYESAPQLGGRARNAPFGELTVDNGQHLLIGAYHETLRLLRMTGATEQALFSRQQLKLKVMGKDGVMIMQAPRLPAPLHLAWAQLSATGLGISERWRALAMSLHLNLQGFTLKQDISVAVLLRQYRQSEKIIRYLWEPLCIATLNTPIERASAQVFLRVLHDSFSHRRADADLLIPRESLGDLFPKRAAHYLSQQGSTIFTRQRVESIQIENNQLESLTVDGEVIPCRQAILATSPHAATPLIDKYDSLTQQVNLLHRLGNQPITTIYLQYPPDHRLGEPMLGLCDSVSQWLFDRRVCGQPGLIAVVISAEGKHEQWDNEKLTAHVKNELHYFFPDWPKPLQSRVIREKRATFECNVGIERRRPQNHTPVGGLWLAGDYTDTGYPATLEGAVRSGVECVRKMLASDKK